VLYGNGSRLEYDLIVAAGARVGQIALSFEGARELRIEDGDLVAVTDFGELRHRRPYLYQRRRGRKAEVAGRFVLLGPLRAGFAVVTTRKRNW
jgi:hypothetical protein